VMRGSGGALRSGLHHSKISGASPTIIQRVTESIRDAECTNDR
jgi:hypothetical protein